ncbi:MAG: hypothetical protein A3F41_00490 [Coxiella sp. RIFCSPHIGHO2_12_FULL_44_14]|nr:MAG: hypothetical protein A3F41_00490 [Coxiella sp. RIFCSPHIGHO2_12_FULL_44_14]
MLYYKSKLKKYSRILRANQTDAELLLWSRLRRKQLCNVQFYRQKPLGKYIVDFYAPSKGLVIEVDGGQHFEEKHLRYDKKRTHFLMEVGLKVLRFDNPQVLQSIEEVMEVVLKELCG